MNAPQEHSRLPDELERNNCAAKVLPRLLLVPHLVELSTKENRTDPCQDANHASIPREVRLFPGEDEYEDDEHHNHADHEAVTRGELH